MSEEFEERPGVGQPSAAMLPAGGTEGSEAATRTAGWRPIESAPRDGQHVLVCDARQSFGWMNGGPLPPVQTVVHWWSVPGEEGFYPSVRRLDDPDEPPFPATHWKPLDGPQ